MDQTQVQNYLSRNEKGWKENILFYDFIEVIAQKASRAIGSSIIFNSENEKAQNILNSWFIRNDIMTILRKDELINSKWGKSIMFLSPSKSGDVNLSLLKLNYNGQVSKVNEKEQTAVLWNQDFSGQIPLFTKITITPETITTEFLTTPRTGVNGVDAPISEELTPITKPIVIPNNFGNVPVVEIENLPINNMFNQSLYNCRPDWEPAINMIQGYNEAYLISLKEIVSNRTRYFGELDPATLKKVQERAKAYNGISDIIGDAWVNTMFGDAYSKGTTGSFLNIVQGNPKLAEYINYLTAQERKIFTACGYEPLESAQKSSGVYENQSTALVQDKLDKETTISKQSYRMPKYYKLFDCVLTYFGVNPLDKDGNRIYSFNFIDSGVSDNVTAIQSQHELLDMGLISRAEARSYIKNEPLNISQKQIDKIDEENKRLMKENLELDAKYNGFGSNDESDNDESFKSNSDTDEFKESHLNTKKTLANERQRGE